MPSRTTSVDTKAPLHLEATVRVLQRRPTNLVDVWQHGAYYRALRGYLYFCALGGSLLDRGLIHPHRSTRPPYIAAR
jgi:hypothetical protein